MGLIRSAYSYLFDAWVPVRNLDCYLVVGVLQRKFHWRTAVTERVRHQLTPNQTLVTRRGVQVVVSGELSDEATRRHAAIYIMRQRQGSVLGHELGTFCSSDTQNDPPSFGGSHLRAHYLLCTRAGVGSNEMIEVHQAVWPSQTANSRPFG
jgi:hypothetical protein